METWSATVDAPFPDPLLSANVYCSGRLCEVIHRLVAPFREAWRKNDPERVTYLWVMRYARCGEHLKIRMHAPESQGALLRELLDSAQRQYLSCLGPSAPGPQPRRTSYAPPIDVEDEATLDYPDRSFLWTRYCRSPLSLGYQPLTCDDRYVALLTRCLGYETEILIGRLRTDNDGRCPYSFQRSLFLQCLIAGLSALPLNSLEKVLFLLYHRDGLLRYLRRRAAFSANGLDVTPDGASVMRKVLARFEREAAQLVDGQDEPTKVAHELIRSAEAHVWSDDLAVWRTALRDLAKYVTPLCSGLSLQLDPFAQLPIFPVFFKVFHGLANQIGVDQLNEAFLCHLLLVLTADEEMRRRPIRLRPIW
jgi:hypothetical protein